MTGTTARSQDCINNNDNGGIITMKTKQELLEMLFAKLAELQDGRIKTVNPAIAKRLRVELKLLWSILGEDVSEEYWEQIEEEI